MRDLALPSTTATDLTNAARLAPWAAAAYGDTTAKSRILAAVRTAQGTWGEWKIYHTHGVWAITPWGVILAVAGTDDNYDWRDNLDRGAYKIASYAEEHGMIVQPSVKPLVAHTGFLQAAGNAKRHLEAIHPELPAFGPVFICGHSLGGAVAELLSYLWPGLAPRVYTYGAPRVLHASSPNPPPVLLTRMVAIDDLVPQVPCGYVHPPSQVKILRGRGQVRHRLGWRDLARRALRRVCCLFDPLSYSTKAHSIALYNHWLRVFA